MRASTQLEQIVALHDDCIYMAKRIENMRPGTVSNQRVPSNLDFNHIFTTKHCYGESVRIDG